MRARFPILTAIAEVAILAIVYYVAGRIGTITAIPPGVATAIWPASGVALSALLLRGNRRWPGVFFGSLVLNGGILGGSAAAVAVAAGIAAGSTLQALLGAELLRRFAGPAWFDSAYGAFRFVAVEMLSCLVAPTVGVTSLALGRFIGPAILGETWVTWWLGDTVGMLVVAPLFLVWGQRRYRFPRRLSTYVELALHVAGLVLLATLVFDLPFGDGVERAPTAYLFLPFILWMAFRLGLHGAVTGTALASVLAVAATLRGSSQFVGATLNGSLLSVQLFVAVVAMTGLVLGAVLRDRERANRERERLLANETRLRQDLARSNEELERFARVASHDLREPLRTVAGYLGRLERSARERLLPEDAENVRRASEGAARMHRLVEALLELSRHGTATAAPQIVPCNDVFDEVVGKLEATIRESGARVSAAPLPTVRGDWMQLEQLFQNLIGNAVKYRTKEQPVEIHVSAERRGGEWLFSVRDNGIGLDMKYAEQIFQAFQRLHGQQEYPGSGLGLSLCRKIVEHHGGRIWVESAPREGSRFCFTLPAEA